MNDNAVAETCKEAAQMHRAGRLAEAEALYRHVLAREPGHAEAHFNRGVVLQMLRRTHEALSSYDQVVVLRPDSDDAYANRGAVLLELGRYQEALASFDTAIALRPDQADVYSNRGVVLKELGRYQESLASFDTAIALRPDQADVYSNRGVVLKELGRYQEALASFDTAIALRPDQSNLYSNYGVVLIELGRYQEALASFDTAIALRPDQADVYSNRGVVLKELGRYQEALASFDTAIALRPDQADVYSNRGVVLKELGRYQEALASFDTAITLRPDYAVAKSNKACLKLLLRPDEEGWRLYEWRWKEDQLKAFSGNFIQPRWLGDETLSGQTILLQAEQGLGDVIQFVRYVPAVEAMGAKVILEVPRPLLSFLRTLPGTPQLIVSGDTLPRFDLHCPLLSLPLAFGTTLETIPAVVPYLYADAVKVSEWRERLGPARGRRIGLAWSGNPEHKNDRNRSIALAEFAPLLRAGAEFISVQKEVRESDRAALEAQGIRHYGDELQDFEDTAALIECLDLVITVDTAVAHLAGALGKPVWILLAYTPDWRWLLQREDSPWYPTARLYRQPGIGDWTTVLQRVAEELRQ